MEPNHTPQPVEITFLHEGESPPFDLLLEADPSREAVERYLNSGICRAARIDQRIAGVCVTAPVSQDTWEIFNIAVEEAYRRQGIAGKLISDAEAAAYAKGARYMEIGTGNTSFSQLRLYQSCGYRITGIISDYFTRRYPQPIWENGIQCRDMVRLRKAIVPARS